MPPSAEPGPLIIAWVAAGRRALIVGGGAVGSRRMDALLRAGGRVTLVAPELSPAVLAARAAGRLVVHQRRFEPSDLDTADLVLVNIDEHDTSAEIARLSRARHIPVHVADDPPNCDFYFAAIHRDEPVQIAVSTGGAGPVLAGKLRDHLAANLPDDLGLATQRFGALRAAVRQACPEDSAGKHRMRWLRDFGRAASWSELAALDEVRIAELAARCAAELAHR